MKTFILGFLALCLSLNLNAQKYVGTKPQTPIKPTRSIPKFLDSVKLAQDLNNLKVLRGIYQQLRKEKVSMVYNYGFNINTLGKTILSHPETSSYMVSLNKYVETTFKNYKWIPAHTLGCKKCSLKSSADFNVLFIPDEKKIVIYLNILEENGSRVFSHSILMK